MPLAAASDAGWSLSIGPLLVMIPVTVAYVVRWRKVRAHPGRLVLFSLGMLAAAVALFSPIDPLGERIFTMHMLQHLLLLDVAPVLILLALTKQIFRPATRRVIAVERHSPWLLSPALGLTLYVAGMWVWHAPFMYDAAVRHPVVHVFEHLTFATIGVLYWWHLISPVRDQRRLTGMQPVLYMAATKVLVGILGIALTFAPVAIYDVYTAQGAEDRWGMTPQEDQSLGGVLMATEQSILMGIALVWLLVSAIDRSEKEQVRRERYGTKRRAPEAAAAPPPQPGAEQPPASAATPAPREADRSLF